MRGVVVEKPGAPWKVVDDLEKPQPGPGQVLVKSIAAAINPVDTAMQQGMYVQSFPVVLGCDASGIVVATGGPEAEAKFKVGDSVCGCTRLGQPGYSTFQEYFLMDVDIAIPKPKNISFEQAATLGAGSETAALGLFAGGFGFPPLDVNKLPPPKDEWLIVLGGATSVGQYVVQLAKLLGYKVLASCSSSSTAYIKRIGADETFDYKKSEDEQISDVAAITGKNFAKIYDATAKAAALAERLLKEVSSRPKDEKHFSTTNPGGSPFPAFDGVHVHQLLLGPRPGYANLAAAIPMIASLVEAGKLLPNEYQVPVDAVGFEGVAATVAAQQQSGGAGGKFVVRLQTP